MTAREKHRQLRVPALALAWLLVWFLGAPAQAQQPPYVVTGLKTYEGNVFAVGQDVIVEGTVKGDVGAVMADIHIKGTVEGNITALGGSVRIYRDANVSGNLLCLGGDVSSHEQAMVGGKIVHHFAPSGPSRESAYLTSSHSMAALFFAQSFFLFLVIIITFYIFPNQVNEASFQLGQDLTRHFIIGLITLATFLLAMFVSILLMVVMVGFPMFLLFSSGLMVVSIFGSVVVFHRVGTVIEELSNGLLSTVASLLMAVLLIGVILHLPLLGTLMQLTILIMGCGVIIETRFGTNKQWFTKKKRYWAAS